jgi:DNA repair ATPase RecN
MLTSGTYHFATIEAEESYVEHKIINGEHTDLAFRDAQLDAVSSRQEHLEDLADQYGVDIETVFALADLLGPNEDHDGLISSLDDLTDFPGFSWEDLTDF